MGKKRPRKGDHIVATGNGDSGGARCTHCGAVLDIKFPVDATVFSAAGMAFVRAHKNCPAPGTKKDGS